MGTISQKKVKEFLDRSQRARKTKTKGQIFEDLVCYLMESVPGISVTKRNVLNPYHSEEVDVGVWNEKAPSGFYFLPNTILIEAKNWSTSVGSQEVVSFIAKLKARGLEFGFLIALNGITGNQHDITAARDHIRQALHEKISFVVVKRADFEGFKSGRDFVGFVKEKLCEMAVSGTQFD
jgi:hypothetical protein